ncbi:NAD(P)/FAD-dependent oxidoreductase [Methylobrevis pamukkalensis]|uniref:Rhodocoxin reductase n=1 Tax=Methylobrevis pamukkalensis TaxID=1439726 RepID=A0A1E3H1S9_9HYPH|nr:FAD-dependent oxidoreductase [Methylobrevis pamukkalensis]ODN70267.1 Rhodocoxin reductase [Methylobrevis pamukkalensis]
MSSGNVVIVGAGHAGVQVAASLRDEGFQGPIRLLSGEADLPYQRPPLSKAYLKGETGAEGLLLRAGAFYAAKDIDLRLGTTALAIDREARELVLAGGERLGYDHLVLATGTRARPFDVPGRALAGVLTLYTLGDAARLKTEVEAATAIVVVGAGFIGLELTAAAVAAGKSVTVIELGARPLGRAVSSEISTFYHGAHDRSGARLLFGAGVAALEGTDGRVEAVVLADGTRVPADLVLVGIGVLAEDRLAHAAGLPCDNGIMVDEFLLTADPAISAIGDCAAFPSPHVGTRLRLESVQNAVDQARCVARRLAGHPEPYVALPWFWSDQGPHKLQIAGLSHGCDRWTMRGDPAEGAFTVFGFRGDSLAVVETVNRPADHMVARKLISAGIRLTPEEAADPAVDLKALLKARSAGGPA